MSCVSEWIENGEAHSHYERVDRLNHVLAPIALRFWEERAPDGIVIGRDVPSRSIARLLSNIIIYQPLGDRRDLRVQIAGSAIRCRFERDITGARMSELFGPNDFPVRFNTMMEVIDGGEPRMACITHTVAGVDVFRLELLMLPVWLASRSSKGVMAFCFYF
jgi:hypothetical protein